MDEKAERLKRIIEEEQFERLKMIARQYRQCKDDQQSKFNAEAVEWAIEKIESSSQSK